ncbi:MAG TPA: universal stress protein [Pinirhizobacter sp.]|uniref:universal stress protein n=1 Tax=Pinirhizobacter sp. TaxID=2950432 RepID=UPI002CFADC38|nr:universal stress protein [Pinirhizobacter sp.]HMH67765.1 universal stress protein [Pinirhizobacter sp.]
MIHDVYVAFGGLDSDGALADATLKVAQAESAHVRAQYLVQMPSPAMAPYGLLASPSVIELYTDLRADTERHASTFHDRLRSAGITASMETIDVFVEARASLAGHGAQLADLALVPGRPADSFQVPCWRDLVVGVLMRSGRPMLMVPPDKELHWPPQRICVAWKPSRESSRAIYDAIPLMKRGATVQVLRAGTPSTLAENSVDPLLAYLSHHGIKAECVDLDTSATSAGQAIVDHAWRVQADLIVAGGYGHSRLREWVLGGVSRQLLELSGIAVLMSH